jgi:hypothetical protein
VSHDVVLENLDFVEGFLAGAKTRGAVTETNNTIKANPASDKRVSLAFSIGFRRWFTSRS